MDAFSRLLASIGQSLGRGLGQVGQTELEQRQRLEALEFQRKAQVSGQLLQTFTQLLQTQGIQEVEPGGIDAIKEAVTDLALGKIDSPAVQRAVSVFPTVAQAANKLSVYRELATKDIDALSRLIVNTDPNEAQRLLGAVGLQGLYDGLRTRGEILTQADRLGLRLTEEQIENLVAQRRALLAELEPRIRLLEAQQKLTEAQAQDILQKLPLVLTRLQLEAQNLAIQIKKGEIEVSKLDDILNAQIRKELAQAGVAEAQAAVLTEQISLIRQQVKSEVLRQAQIEAETEKIRADTKRVEAETKEVEARTRWVDRQIKELDDRYKLDVVKGRVGWLKDLLGIFLESGTTNPELIKAVLTSPLDPFALPEDIANPLSVDIAKRVKEAVTARELQLVDAVSKTSATLLALGSQSDNPEEAKKFALRILPEGVNPEVREFVGGLAKKLSTAEIVAKQSTKVKELLELPPPPKGSESGLLKDLYDQSTKRFGKAYANSIVNLIKSYWEAKREAQAAELTGKSAEVAIKKAQALYYSAMAASIPQELGLKREELKLKREDFDFEKWFKTQQIEQGWARIKLEELEQLARQNSDKNIAELIVKLTTGAKNVGALAKELLSGELMRIKAATCADLVRGSASESLAAIIAGIGKECNQVIEGVLKDKDNPVGVAFENAMAYQKEVIEAAAALLGSPQQVQPGTAPGNTQPGSPAQPGGNARPGGATPGGTTPTVPGTGSRPSGTIAPMGTPSGAVRGALGSDFASGAKTAFNILKQFGVQIPNDFKEAGAMVFTYGTEFGNKYNPFQVTEGARVPMQEITIKKNGKEEKIKVPVGPDKGFQAVIDADKPGTRKKALAIDSAIAFGSAWIFPNETPKPRMLAKYIREDFRRDNPGVFRRADYFKNERGEVDMVSVASGYAAMSLERLGVPVQYNRTFTTLLRTLAQNDLEILEMRKPLPPEMAKERYLNLVRYRYENDPKLIEDARRQYDLSVDASRNAVIRRVLESAMMLYDATRLSNIGSLVLGGGR